MQSDIPESLGYKVNDVVYHPLSDPERERIREQLKSIQHQVERFLQDMPPPVEVVQRCMESFTFWCNHFAYTFDPRDPRDPHKRFILYPYQEKAAQEFIDTIENGGTLCVDKSRDMGATWLSAAVITWYWLFSPSFHALIGSRKEDLVDDKTIDSIFGKIDYLLDWQPTWLLNGYEKTKENRPKLRIKHPCGNLITGESSNINFGRGPRKNLVYLDEFAFWENDRAVWTGIQDTAPARIVTSTPYGEANQFARIRFSENRKLVTFHWTMHPEKDLAWYNSEKEKRFYDEVAIAQELDINYQASAGGLCFPQFTHFTDDRYRCQPMSPTDATNTGARFYAGMDWGTTNPTSFHVYRVRKLASTPVPVYEIISVWEYYEPSTLKAASDAIKGCPYYPLIERIYADPSMWFDNQTDDDRKSMTNMAALFLKHHQILLHPGKRGDAYARTLLESMISQDNPLFKVSHACPNQWDEFQRLRYEKQTSFMASKKNLPEKMVDKDNHSWDDFKYFINSHFNAEELPQEPKNIPMGMTALNQEIQALKEKKLRGLQKPQRRKRYF